MTQNKDSQNPVKICNAKNARGIACKYKAKGDSDKCGRCQNKPKNVRSPMKKGFEHPNALNFGGRGWTTFLDDKIIELAAAALSTPDYFNLNQEIEYCNVDLARLAKELGDGNGYPFEKFQQIRELYNKSRGAWYAGEADEFSAAFGQLGGLIEFCSEQYLLRQEFNRAMTRKADFISRQQAIKEKERLFVSLEQMLVFGATLIQVIDHVLAKHDKQARKYRQALFTALAPKFGFEINRTNKLAQIGDGEISDKPEDSFIVDVEAEEIAELEDDAKLDEILAMNEESEENGI